MAGFPAPAEGIVLTHFIVASDTGRTRRFYADVLGGEVLREGEPSIVALANSWIVINAGGPPTHDKPTVTLEPPRDPDHVSSFLNTRVAGIHAVYEQWRARGAEFLTPPTGRRHELRCYMRDPDAQSSRWARGSPARSRRSGKALIRHGGCAWQRSPLRTGTRQDNAGGGRCA
jgi:Glyoxalase-like domain